METVSTKLTGLKSKMMAWKLGWGSPRVRKVGLGGVLPSAPLSSITATPGPFSPSSVSWGREGDPASLHGGWWYPWLGSVPCWARPALSHSGAWRGSWAALGHRQWVSSGEVTCSHLHLLWALSRCAGTQPSLQ